MAIGNGKNLMKSFESGFSVQDGEVKITSKQIADWTNKSHDNILKDIRKEIKELEEIGVVIFHESSYVNVQNKSQPCYIMYKDGVMQLAMKYDAKIRHTIIQKLNEMDKQIKELKNEIKDISQIAISDDTQSRRILELNKLNFSERMTQKSFKNCVDYKQYEDMLSRFLEYIKSMSAEQRVLKMEHAIKGMEILRRNLLLDNMANVGNTINIDNDIKNMLKLIDKINNKSLGGEKAAKTKKIQSLKNEKDMLESQLINGFNPFA